MNKVAKKIRIYGIVQGVGFRPFIFKMAKKNTVQGFVKNTSYGVSIEAEAIEENLKSFVCDIKNNIPPLALITKIVSLKNKLKNYEDFLILDSKTLKNQLALIPYDVGVCKDCLCDIFNKKNRRYLYPFTNCTNCGPRYTIIKSIPYDRKNTSMANFTMCKDCQEEYDNPYDRRFHAQPNACFKCGPSLNLYDSSLKKIKRNEIKTTISLLKQGKIIAIKGLGGFHLAGDPLNDEVVLKLREKKTREEKPFALMCGDIAKIKEIAFLSDYEEKLLNLPQNPIVLLKKKETNCISKHISPNNAYFGIMLAYTPLHQILLKDMDFLIMTSANKKDEPIVIDNDEAFEKLKGIADYFLVHNRDIYIRSDDSIVRAINNNFTIIRRSRGFVPIPIFLKNKAPEILACGGELKNTICLTKGNAAFLSQYIGDLDNTAAYNFFKDSILHLQKILKINPEIIVCDKHPQYLSSIYAKSQKDKKIIEVQHHHSHIVSCMAENKIQGDVIGLAFDGTGFGEDGKIWGGEVLITNEKSFIRKAHIRHMKMIGGDMAAKEPYRMALSLLYDAFGKDCLNLNLTFLNNMDKQKIEFLMQMFEKNINSPKTSGMGRLFDGISSLINIRHINSFEGQAAISLEMMTDENEKDFYNSMTYNNLEIDTRPLTKDIVKDLLEGKKPSLISAKFHNTIVYFFTNLCKEIQRDTSLNKVVLSGGVFQNAFLLKSFIKSFKRVGLKVYFHSKVPSNDGGLSLGQAVIGANLI